MTCAEVTNVRVALRCRPLNSKENSAGEVSVFRKDGSSSARLADPDAGGSEIEFGFDHVYDFDSTQAEVFEAVGKPVVTAAFDGFNSTVFAYGQTGSGKSWSMTGDLSSEADKGLIPRINQGIFDRIEAEKNDTRKFLVQMSLFEIYNEVIYDLLDMTPRRDKQKTGGLQVKEHPVLGIHVKGLQQIVAGNAEKVAELMELGSKNRTVGATQMNAESSRSHSICLLLLHQKDTADESRNVYAKVNLVDLAGSERADKTGAKGARLKEGANINKSLSTLGNVINGLVERARGKKGVFIPYRDSKLTRVLQESLGGNALCTMLATLSPAKCNARESLSTLRYAARAKTIKVSVTKNEEAGQVSLLNEEVAKLKKLLAEKAAEAQSKAALGGGQDVEALRAAEEKLAQQIADTEALTKQTWEEKQEASRRHEAEVARMRKAHQEAARRADAERRRRFQLLRLKADVELSVKELSLPAKWAESARHVRTLEIRAKEHRARVGVFRDALAADLRHLRYASDDGQTAAADTATSLTFALEGAAASALVKRGAAEAVQARFSVLVKELAKLQEADKTLEAEALQLVADVDASLQTLPSAADDDCEQNTPSKAAKDARNRERTKLVLEQCVARRDSLRRDSTVGRATLLLATGQSQQHSDLCSMARELAAELHATRDALVALGETTSESVLAKTSENLTKSAIASTEAASLALGISEALEKQFATNALLVGDDIRGKSSVQHVNPVSGSSGDVVAATGWRPDTDDSDAFLHFEFSKPSSVSRVRVLPGTVVDDSNQAQDVTSMSVRVDGTDHALTLELMGGVISWQSLRLKRDKVEKLLERPPVRFLQDIVAAITAAVENKFWLAKEVPATSNDASKESRRIFFDTLLDSVASTPSVSHLIETVDSEDGGLTAQIGGLVVSTESVLAGKGVDGTNALLQVLAIAATGGLQTTVNAATHRRWKTQATSVSVDIETSETGEWQTLGKFLIDVSTGYALLPSDAAVATRCRVRPEAFIWNSDDDDIRECGRENARPACKAIVEVVEPTSTDGPETTTEAVASAIDKGDTDLVSEAEAKLADEKLDAELAGMKEIMVSGVTALVAGNRQIVLATSRALQAATEAERGKTEELVEEVNLLRETASRAELHRKASEEMASRALTECDKLRASLESSRERVARIEEEASDTTSKLSTAEETVSRLTVELSTALERCETLAATGKEAVERQSEASKALDEANVSLEQARKRCVELEREVREAKEHTASAETAAEQAHAQYLATSSELVEAETVHRSVALRCTQFESQTPEANARFEAQRVSAMQRESKNDGVQEEGKVAGSTAALKDAPASSEAIPCLNAETKANLETDLAALRTEITSLRNKDVEASCALEAANKQIDHLNESLHGAENEVSRLELELKSADASRDKLTRDAEELQAILEQKASAALTALAEAESRAEKSDREREAEKIAAGKTAEEKLQDLDDKLKLASQAAEDANREAVVARGEAEIEKEKAQTADKAVRKALADAAAAKEICAKESDRAASAERAVIEHQTKFLGLESECDALSAQLRASKLDASAAREAQAIAEAAVDEISKVRDESVYAAETADLALKVAEEERDAARDKEEQLANEIELLREDLDNGSVAYVNLTDRLAETRDELDDARERLEKYAENEKSRANDFINASVDLESRHLAQQAKLEADTLRAGVRTLRNLLDQHLDSVGLTERESTDKNEAAAFLVHAVTKLLNASMEHHQSLHKSQDRLKNAEDREQYEDDFE